VAVHWFLRLWLATGALLSLLFAAVGAALWWLFRAEGSSLSPAPSSSLSSVAQSLLAAEAAVAGEAVEPEL